MRRKYLGAGGRLTLAIGSVLAALLLIPQAAFANTYSFSGSMEGSMVIHPGDLLFAGLDFKLNEDHLAAVIEFDNVNVQIPYSCQKDNGTFAGVITITPTGWNAGTYTVPLNDRNWQPADLESSYTVWQSGAYAAPDLCSGGPMYTTDKGTPKNPTITFDLIQDSPSTPLYPVTVRWHYRDPNAKGFGNTNYCSQPGANSTACGASWSSSPPGYDPDPGPGTQIPEVPFAVLLPLTGAAVLTGFVVFTRVRRSQREAGGS